MVSVVVVSISLSQEESAMKIDSKGTLDVYCED